ncbi:hypothetical protein HZB01_03370 [Candidatus Woesearchaeota archaeon]|nr:hypothetical protein [Candidatus Woesearchaeota archaeon]
MGQTEGPEEKTMHCGTSCCGAEYEDGRFLTKDEKVKMLLEYKEKLEQEVKGIEETISSLKKAA